MPRRGVRPRCARGCELAHTDLRRSLVESSRRACPPLSRPGFTSMLRREFLTFLGGAAAGWPLAARAQQTERMRRIGVLIPSATDDREFQARLAAFLQELRQLGWTDRNVHIDTRWGAGNADLIRKHAVELVASGPDVIVALTSVVVAT